MIPLFSLEECDRGFVPVPAPAGGGSYSAPANAPSKPQAPGAHKMLQDPEGTFDESITIYGDSLNDALRKCQNAANARSQGAIASCLGCRLMTSPQTGRYACTLRIEPRK